MLFPDLSRETKSEALLGMIKNDYGARSNPRCILWYTVYVMPEDKVTETDVWKGDKKLNVMLVILIPDISWGGQ